LPTAWSTASRPSRRFPPSPRSRRSSTGWRQRGRLPPTCAGPRCSRSAIASSIATAGDLSSTVAMQPTSTLRRELRAPTVACRTPDETGLARHGVGFDLRLFDLIRGPTHTLLLYADSSVNGREVEGFEDVAREVRDLSSGLTRSYLLLADDTPTPILVGLPVIRDRANEFRSIYGMAGSAAYLVRPD